MEYHNDAEDKFYKWKGVRPPERTPHGVSSDDLSSLLAKNKHKCEWKQKGNEVFCTSAPDFDHGFRVPPNKLLQGTGSQGEPLLRDVSYN